jgi:hypothetical protein
LAALQQSYVSAIDVNAGKVLAGHFPRCQISEIDRLQARRFFIFVECVFHALRLFELKAALERTVRRFAIFVCGKRRKYRRAVSGRLVFNWGGGVSGRGSRGVAGC